MKIIFLILVFSEAAIQYTEAIECYVCQNCSIPREDQVKRCDSMDQDQCKVEVVEKMVNRMCHEDLRQGLGCKNVTEDCYCDSNKCNDNEELKEAFCDRGEQYGEDFKKIFPRICGIIPGGSGKLGMSVVGIVGIVVGVIVVAVVITIVAWRQLRSKKDDGDRVETEPMVVKGDVTEKKVGLTGKKDEYTEKKEAIEEKDEEITGVTGDTGEEAMGAK